jgi:hypothetical protein
MATGFVEAECLSNAPYLRVSDEPFHPNERLGNLTVGKRYRAQLDGVGNWIRVWDDLDQDYLYPIQMFRIVAAGS